MWPVLVLGILASAIALKTLAVATWLTLKPLLLINITVSKLSLVIPRFAKALLFLKAVAIGAIPFLWGLVKALWGVVAAAGKALASLALLSLPVTIVLGLAAGAYLIGRQLEKMAEQKAALEDESRTKVSQERWIGTKVVPQLEAAGYDLHGKTVEEITQLYDKWQKKGAEVESALQKLGITQDEAINETLKLTAEHMQE